MQGYRSGDSDDYQMRDTVVVPVTLVRTRLEVRSWDRTWGRESRVRQ